MSDITIYTLAEELNMTPSMVSRAFNPNGKISEDKRKIILDAAKKYNFYPNKLASRLSMKTVHIGVLINSRFQINTDKMILGIKNAYEKLKDYKIKYDIKVVNPLDNTFDDCKNILYTYKDYDGIILTGMSSEKYTDLINELYNINPNIVQVQAINKKANYLFAVKHNEETASYLAVEFLYNCLKKSENKNILLFTGDKESALHANVEIAFKKACKKYGLNLLDSIDMKDNEEYFEKIINNVMKKNIAKTNGIYVASGLSGPLCRYIEKNGVDVPFVSFDVYDELKYYIEKEIVSATISQNIEKQTETAFEGLVNHIITGEKCPKVIYTDIQLVLKSNMYQFN